MAYAERSVRLLLAVAAVLTLIAEPAHAQDTYPKRLGRQVVVENRPGAASIVGSEIVAKAPPDGYTLLLTPATLAINPAV